MHTPRRRPTLLLKAPSRQRPVLTLQPRVPPTVFDANYDFRIVHKRTERIVEHKVTCFEFDSGWVSSSSLAWQCFDHWREGL